MAHRGRAVFYTLTFDADERILEDHPTLDEAEAFAEDVAAEGCECALLRTVAVLPAKPPKTPEEEYGLTPGADFPASLARRSAVRF